MSRVSIWRPPVGSAVRVTIPAGPEGGARTLDTATCSEVFHSPPLVAVYGLRECVALSLVAPLPADAKPLEYETRNGPFGPWRFISPRWNT